MIAHDLNNQTRLNKIKSENKKNKCSNDKV